MIGKDLTVMDYSDRIAAVQMSGIALWDVVGIAERVGSLDHHIHNARPNDLREFVGRLPELRVIAFNGKKAATLAANVFDDMAIDVLQLPSSSPAYTVHLEVKAAVWAGLKGHFNVQK